MLTIQRQDAAAADDDDADRGGDERHTDNERRRDNDLITASADSPTSDHNDDGELSHNLLVNK